MTTDHPGEEQRDGAGATPPKTVWSRLTYRFGAGTGIDSMIVITDVAPTELRAAVNEAYDQDIMLWLDGPEKSMGYPAQRLISLEIRPCLPHEIPRET